MQKARQIVICRAFSGAKYNNRYSLTWFSVEDDIFIFNMREYIIPAVPVAKSVAGASTRGAKKVKSSLRVIFLSILARAHNSGAQAGQRYRPPSPQAISISHNTLIISGMAHIVKATPTDKIISDFFMLTTYNNFFTASSQFSLDSNIGGMSNIVFAP